MARYLSAEWFDDVARHADAPVDAPIALEQVVIGTPDGEVRYRVVVGDGSCGISRTFSGPATATFTCDYATATAVAQGSLSLQEALAAGRVRVGGDLARLAEVVASGALSGLDPLPADVRASTSWPVL